MRIVKSIKQYRIMIMDNKLQGGVEVCIIENVHISTISVGDIIRCNDGRVRTVCSKDIKTNNLMGISIFGDCYNNGHKLVEKVVKYIN